MSLKDSKKEYASFYRGQLNKQYVLHPGPNCDILVI